MLGKKTKRIRRHPRTLSLENLENREMFSANASLNARELMVTGTSASDDITVLYGLTEEGERDTSRLVVSSRAFRKHVCI